MPFDMTTVLAAGGGGAAVAYGFFKYLGTKWLEAKFQSNIEILRHQQRQEFETFKISTNTALDRLNKLNQREYDVLPKAWELLVTLNLHVSRLLASYREYPDLESMSSAQFDEYVAKSDMADFQKAEIRTSKERNKYYQELVFWKELSNAHNVFSEYAKYIMFNSVFFSKELKTLFKQAEEKIWSAIVSKKISKEVGAFPNNFMNFYEQWTTAMKEVNEIMEKIEDLVQSRLNRI